MFKPAKLAVAMALVSGALLSGCNGGSSSSSSSPPPPAGPGGPSNPGPNDPGPGPTLLQGRFVEVEGIDVTAQEVPAAVTGAGGSFQYRQNDDEVTFSLGNIALPPVDASPVITPLDMSADGASYDDRVVNIMRLLETLDADPARPGIQISQAAKDASGALELDFDLPVASFANDTNLINYLSALGLTELASQEDATRTLHCGLAQVGVSTSYSLVGSHLVLTEDEEIDALLVFGRDGRFYMAQFLAEPEFGAIIGYEVGSYSRLGDEVRFSITEDTNGTAGTLSDESGPGACPADGPAPNVFTLISADASSATFVANETPPTPFTANRVDITQGQMAGTWRQNDQTIIVFDGDDLGGNYYLIEYNDPSGEAAGVELGTYTRSGNLMSVDTLIDTNGDAGLSDIAGSFGISISGETMTLEIEEDGGTDVVTLTRID